MFNSARNLKGMFALLLIAASVSATTIVPMSVERLTEASTAVVRARAEASWSRWNEARTQIHTYTRFRSQSALKGAPAQTFVVRQMGGALDGVEQRVSGVRSWRKGEEAVLFLRPSREEAETFAVVGLMQGDFRISRSASGEEELSNGVATSEVQAFDPNTRTVSRYSGAHLTRTELERRVRAAVKRSAAGAEVR